MLWSLALRTRPLGGAGTGVAVDAVSAGSSVLAGIARALVHVLIAILTRPAWVTATGVASGRILGKLRQKLCRLLHFDENRTKLGSYKR